MKGIAFLIFLLVQSVSAQTTTAAGPRRSCPETPAPATPRSLAELDPILRANNIEILQGNTVTPSNVERFLVEYNKMPQSLRSEMISRRAGIRLMEGSGVGIDSSLTATHTQGGDRQWINVPGSGGLITEHHNIPTRLAINHLYDHSHGASNLVLHEHAHTLDSIYGEHALSSSPAFRNLLSSSPRASEFLNVLCVDGYCAPEKPVEAFAELFAYYYGCQETKAHMEEVVPEIAAFFQNFNSASALLNGQIPGWSPRAITEVGSAIPEARSPASEDCDTSPTADFNRSISDFKAVSNKLKQTYPAPQLMNSGSTGVSAAGMK